MGSLQNCTVIQKEERKNFHLKEKHLPDKL